jgi:ABC-2 type transport system permease protein
MNFVIFPMFFLSSALYPLWRMDETSHFLYLVSAWNPFTQAVELIRFALYGGFNPQAALYTVAALAIFLGLAVYAYNPSRGFMSRKGGPEG